MPGLGLPSLGLPQTSYVPIKPAISIFLVSGGHPNFSEPFTINEATMDTPGPHLDLWEKFFYAKILGHEAHVTMPCVGAHI